jgi:RPA family protein
MARLIAKRVRISDLLSGGFFSGSREELKPSYVITHFGEIVSRVNLCGSVTSKFENDIGTYANVTVDDGTDVISVRVFKDISLLKNIEVGDTIVVVGKIKEYNGERYVNVEVARKLIDKNYESYRKLEIAKTLIQQKKIVDEVRELSKTASEEELKNYASERGLSEEVLNAILKSQTGVDYKSKILELINALDNGDGVEIGKIFELSKLPENVIENAVSSLLEEGSLYEPIVGKLKKV